jgi:cysteinyl-tRNA synthetase
MSLRFHNQLTRTVDEFQPIEDGFVNLYTCGPTVYNYLTVGNWTAYIYWDILVRTLTAHGNKVTRVMNITDVGHLVSDADDGEDKLEKGAKREGKSAWDVAAFYTADFKAGLQALNLVMPTHLPKATDFIEQQIELVRILKEKGYTYQIDDGIYFDTLKFPTYANFAGLDLDAQKAGARVEFNPEKHHPSDFALWKFTAAGEKRDMQWPTPIDLTESKKSRMGFPGWHLECSAMAMSLLGETIDIHTGGIDHIPVHHTNEIAQSEAASGKIFSNVWMHNNHLKVEGTKISKSLGNGYTLQDLADKGYSPLDLKLFVLQSHYRTEGNFTFDNLTAAANRRNNWRNIAALRHQMHDTIKDDESVEDDSKTVSLYAATQKLLEAVSDNLNTPAGLAIIDEAFDDVQSSKLATVHQHALKSFLEAIDELLGLDLLGSTPDITDEQKKIIIQRTRAREQKDFATSDQLRSELEKSGVTVRDTASGPIWEYVTF